MKRACFHKNTNKHYNIDIQIPSDNLKTNYLRMKKLFLLVQLITILNLYGFTQDWTKQESYTNSELRSVFFITKDVGFVTGYNGTILKTTNGGNNWYPINSNTSDGIYSLCFTDSTTGYAISWSGLLKTTDCGEHWIIQDTSAYLSKINFIDKDTGFVCGSRVLLKTTDGGLNWTRHKSANANVISFIAASSKILYVGSSNSNLYKSSDGGENWSTVHGPGLPCDFYNLNFMNQDTGFAVGGGWAQGSSKGVILKTTNGGISWSDFIIDITLNSIFVVDEGIGYAVGNSGTIFKTKDLGTNWTKLATGITNNLNSIFFVDSLTGYAVGSNGVILKTTNGGSSNGVLVNHEATVDLYPNPFTNYITIETKENADNLEFNIYNIEGKLIIKQKITQQRTQLDLSILNSGFYFAELKSNESIKITKLIKE
jgi:photosystem II stability/assembly factor-like uncharacterized protein